MKNIIAIISIMTLAAISALAAQYNAIDMASYGTTASITNAASVETTITEAIITYDAVTTNTIAIYVNKGGIDYRIGTSTVSNAQYATVDLTDIGYKAGNVLKITTTDTNVNILVKSE